MRKNMPTILYLIGSLFFVVGSVIALLTRK